MDALFDVSIINNCRGMVCRLLVLIGLTDIFLSFIFVRVYLQLLQISAVCQIRQVFKPVAPQSSEKWVPQSFCFYLCFAISYKVFNFLAFKHRSSGTWTIYARSRWINSRLGVPVRLGKV